MTRVTEATTDSLPLMGIGNAGAGELGVVVALLITPHGDRKPSPTSTLALDAVRSLPLMGIGNASTGLPSSGQSNSLPLMGIGNQGEAVCAHGRSVLITPHGDRKLAGYGGHILEFASHYPSWGSETPQAPTIYKFAALWDTGCKAINRTEQRAWSLYRERLCARAHARLSGSDHRPVLAMPIVRLLAHLATPLLLGESDDTDVVAVLAG